MKYSLSLTLMLLIIWLTWSGHFDKPFVIALGILSCLGSVWISSRMKIVDEEGAPVQMGLRPFYQYAPWLAWQVFKSNLEVARIILSPAMPLHRNMVTFRSNAKCALGKVMLANSVTLTPGTVSVRLDGDEVLIHALSFEGDAEDIAGEMDRRIQTLERAG